MHPTKSFPVPVDRDFVVFVKGVNKVLGIFLMNGFDAEVVGNQVEGYVFCLVFEDSGGVRQGA